MIKTETFKIFGLFLFALFIVFFFTFPTTSSGSEIVTITPTNQESAHIHPLLSEQDSNTSSQVNQPAKLNLSGLNQSIQRSQALQRKRQVQKRRQVQRKRQVSCWKRLSRKQCKRR